ncbi:FAD-dependent monooxygenase [Saccharothrix sp. BKS2]|uniref:FAD-dependent monooxygenase n=1 Tax=Saccharothrix sp. BKS2 TaxID=3064400 RepID=UPI0039ECA837
MPEPLPHQVDVLVVGAGPTGLTLGCALRSLGVDHLVLDQADEPARHSRAAVVHARTLETLALVGAADELVARGLPAPAATVRNRDGVLLSAAFHELGTPYPFALCVPQETTEQVLGARLRQLGGSVRRGHALIDVHEGQEGVTAVVADPGGTARVVRARYLVGCDGLRSAVRERSGIAFTGRTDPHVFALAEVAMDWSGPVDAFTYYLSPGGTLLVSPLPDGRFRVAAPVPPDAPAPDLAAVRRLLDDRGPGGARVRSLDVSSTWRVRYRVAETFGRGPVFLAGDAAHVHSPAGGQGMNSGIQDAVNLAWKLAAVLDGTAGSGLLRTYDAERRPVAEAAAAFSEQLTRAVTTGMHELRDDLVRSFGSTPRLTRWLATRLAQLDVRYGAVGHRVAPGPATTPRLGWSLLVPTAAGVAAARSAVVGRPITVEPAEDRSDAVLVRPDGYAAATAPTAEVHRLPDELTAWLHGPG